VKTCGVEDCERSYYARDLCKLHYYRAKRNGHPTKVVRLWKATLAQRLDMFIDRSGGPDACWPWTRKRSPDGYGRVTNYSGTVQAHRAVMEQLHGPIDPDLDVMHLCNNPPCCNPAHLRIGTAAENMAYMVACGRALIVERQAHAKLTAADVMAIRKRRASGETMQRIADDYGVSSSHVSYICSGRVWKHLPLT
jgi:hypothetical protein